MYGSHTEKTVLLEFVRAGQMRQVAKTLSVCIIERDLSKVDGGVRSADARCDYTWKIVCHKFDRALRSWRALYMQINQCSSEQLVTKKNSIKQTDVVVISDECAKRMFRRRNELTNSTS